MTKLNDAYDQIGNLSKSTKPKAINLSNYTFSSSVDASPILVDLIKNQGYSTIYLPTEIWLNTTLNLTDLDGVSLIGCGRYELQASNETLVHLNTGSIGIDITGSQNMLFKDMNLHSRDETNYSKIGILEGRSTSNQYAQFNRFDNIKINMKHDMAANGGIGTLGIYNFKSELNTYNNIFIQADKPMILTISNLYNVSSPFVTQAGEASMKSTAFTGMTTLVARYGHALIIDGANDVVFDHLYMQNYRSDTDNTEPYAIWVTAPNALTVTQNGTTSTVTVDYQVNNIEICNFDNEIFQGFMKVQCKLSNSRFHGQHSHGQGDIIHIVANDASHSCGMAQCDISINKAVVPVGTQYLVYAEAGSNGFHSCLIRMANSLYGLYSDVVTYGNIILASSSNGRPTLTFVGGDKYTLIGPSGFLLHGKLFGMSGKPSSGTYNAGDVQFNWDGSSGQPAGYFCTVGGTPGTWVPFGQLGYRFTTGYPTLTPNFIGEKVLDGNTKVFYVATDLTTTGWIRETWTATKGTTANRPTGLGVADAGLVYLDTTLVPTNGKPITWNGTAWVDSTGATV